MCVPDTTRQTFAVVVVALNITSRKAIHRLQRQAMQRCYTHFGLLTARSAAKEKL